MEKKRKIAIPSKAGIKWPGKNLEYQRAMQHFNKNAKVACSMSDAVKELQTVLKNPATTQVLERSLSNLHNIAFNPFSKMLTPSRLIFKQKSFRVLPTDWEVEHKIFIPGHRFFPFHQIKDEPSTFSLSWKSRSIPTTNITLAMEDLIIYFNLLPMDDWPPLFLTEDVENDDEDIGESWYSNNGEILLEVFDMSDFFRENTFRSGDEIEFYISSYLSANYKISYISKQNKFQDRKNIIEMEKLLERNIISSIQPDQPKITPKLILDSVSIMSENNNFNYPIIPLGAFVNNSEIIEFQHFNYFDSLIIVPLGANPTIFYQQFFDRISDDAYDREPETLEDFFRMGKLNLFLATLRAIILDDITFKQKGPEELLTYITDLMDLSRWEDRHLETFIKLFYKEIDKTIEKYDYYAPDEKINNIRSRIVEQIDVHFQFLIKLDETDVDIDLLPTENLQRLADIDLMLSDFLQFLDTNPASISDEKLEFLESDIDHVINLWKDNTRDIKRTLGIVF